ncbi:MAG: tetratricopeptide repeat protein, partial [Myxococcales bacterium]|nr:tetratricopeptide repeat protein [Myxococcales bacterium]
EARDLAQQAKDMAPAKLSPLIVLAEIYMQSGLTKNAKREINAALELDPKSEIVKNLQRTLKG